METYGKVMCACLLFNNLYIASPRYLHIVENCWDPKRIQLYVMTRKPGTGIYVHDDKESVGCIFA